MTSSVAVATGNSTGTDIINTARGGVKAQYSDSGVVATGNSTGINTARGAVKTQCSDSGVVESDTDTMSCYDDDSSPDHYQPIGSHLNGGVADKNKTTGKCVAPKNVGVAETRPVQTGNSDSNDFPQLSDAGIILNDDPELDRIFASVEVTHIHTHAHTHCHTHTHARTHTCVHTHVLMFVIML